MERRGVLNRSLVTLGAKLPFVAWLNDLPGVEPPPRLLLDRNLGSYLIPRVETEDDFIMYLATRAERIFERELLRWWPSEYNWPRSRDLVTLEGWFEVTLHPTIQDVAEGPIQAIEDLR